jgi:hypothetical protein
MGEVVMLGVGLGLLIFVGAIVWAWCTRNKR